jgi:hypothetical protein
MEERVRGKVSAHYARQKTSKVNISTPERKPKQ